MKSLRRPTGRNLKLHITRLFRRVFGQLNSSQGVGRDMSRVQDQDGRRVRLPSHSIAVTDIKPTGLTAIRPTAGPVQKTKEGLYQNRKGPGCITLSSVMVKAIKSALMEAAEYNNPVDGKRKTGSTGVKGRPQQKYGIYAKCTAASPTQAPNKKSMNISTSNNNKKKGSGLMSKLELISRMNMEGVVGPRSTSAMELPTLKKNSSESPTQTKASHKKKSEISPARMPRSPTRKVQKDNSKRKSMVSIPVGSPGRKTSGSKKSTHSSADGPSVKNTNQLPPGCLETRSHLSSLSLDNLKSPQKQRIEPDITTYEFMRKLMSYSSTGFREVRDERRVVKTPTLDAIPEES
uniref:Kinesin-like protein KIF26B n=2 Tax=Lygus hesperus TaxID=30085 RepID=A0A0A9YTT4_LYGHE